MPNSPCKCPNLVQLILFRFSLLSSRAPAPCVCRIAQFFRIKKERMRTLDIQPGFQQREHNLRELERQAVTLDEETSIKDYNWPTNASVERVVVGVLRGQG